MKIEYAQPVKNIPEKMQQQLLKQGDFFTSEVLEVRGETALLRTAQGALLTARLLADLGLAAGDYVETVVDEASGGRYVLRLLEVSRQNVQPGNSEAGASAGAAAQNMRAQVLHNAMTMMKKNAGLDPKIAEFLARNGIADTPENIETLARLARGEQRIAQVLTQMQGEAASAKTVAENTAAAAARPTAFEPVARAMVIETAPPSTGQEAAGTAVISEPVLNNMTPESKPQAVPTPNQVPLPQAGGAAPQNTGLTGTAAQDIPEAALTPGAAATQAETQTSAKTAAEGMTQQPGQTDTEIMKPGTVAGQSENKQEPTALLRQLLTFFVDLKDKETLPAQLKRAVEELPEQIKELKLSMQTPDNIDRNTLAHKAESLDRQMTLMSEVKRFDCYHIPLMGKNNEPGTAELFVYRQRRRKKETEPETYAVLLGLDTQHMGRVEAMIRAAGRSVTLEFALEQAELSDAFAEGAAELEPLIAQTGYRLSQVSVRELSTRTTVLNAEEALTQGQAANTGGLDIKI